MAREVQGLKWVRALGEARPGCIPKGRPRGVKAEGVRYEKALVGALGASHGIWFEYEDAKGHGFAQVDFLFAGGVAVVGEAKLTWKPQAYVQLRKLYFPLLKFLLGAPVGGIVICKNVTRETPKDTMTASLPEALDRARKGSMIPVLHWPIILGGTT